MGVSRSLKISVTALFAAFASILEILPLDLRFPLYEKVTLDPTGIPLTLALYMFGIDVASVATIVTGLVISLPRPPFKGPNPIGAFFKSLAELSTLLGIYASRRLWKSKLSTLLWSLVTGVTTRAIVMTTACIALLPLFYGVPQHIVFKIAPIIAVFNLVQGTLNIVIGYLLYEPIKKRVYSSLYSSLR